MWTLIGGIVNKRKIIRFDILIYFNCPLHIPVEDQPSVIQHDAPCAKLADGVHIMADIEDRAALRISGIAHFAEALLLELHVSHGENLIHDHDLTIEMCGDGEGQFDIHAAGVTLHRRVDELFHLRKLNDLVEFAVDLCPRHTENRAIHIDILSARQFRMKARTNLQHRGNAAVIADRPLGRRGDAG